MVSGPSWLSTMGAQNRPIGLLLPSELETACGPLGNEEMGALSGTL